MFKKSLKKSFSFPNSSLFDSSLRIYTRKRYFYVHQFIFQTFKKDLIIWVLGREVHATKLWNSKNPYNQSRA